MLRISQTFAQIGIQTQNAQLILQSARPTLSIQQKHAELRIQSELPRVHIDQYQCFAEAGLKNNMDLLREAAQIGKQQAMQYIAKTAADGDRLAAIENGGNPIVDIVERDAYSEKEFNIGVIPKSRPKIEVTGSLWINAHSGSVQTDYEPGQLDIHATRPEIKIYLRQVPSVQIQYVGENVDIHI
ncbi:MAG: hypothetical protein PWR27_2291 [Petroclostridium sp.]|nr:hypothetical protein [Petroclostridium sp.]